MCAIIDGHAKCVIATREDDSGSDGVCLLLGDEKKIWKVLRMSSHDEHITA